MVPVRRYGEIMIKEESALIEVRDLVKRYGKHTAVDRLSFSVEKGQVYGFLGPNGAGKSTTMNIMTGYIGPTAGEVLIDGVSVVAEPEKAKAKIGYLPEQPPLYDEMTALEYLQFVAGLKKIPGGERRKQIETVMDMTKINQVQGRLIRNLSKGFRQRVGLAQAILGFPEVIILDEPTVGLDPKQIIEIRALIRGLREKHTVILSSHILTEVQEICDRILIIHQGVMVAAGTQEELESRYKESEDLHITVKGSPGAARKALAQVAGERALVVPAASQKGEASLIIKNEKNADLRERAFQCCVDAGLPILELRLNRLTLEDIFLKLTTEDVALTAAAADADTEPEVTAPEDTAPADTEQADTASQETAEPEEEEQNQ